MAAPRASTSRPASSAGMQPSASHLSSEGGDSLDGSGARKKRRLTSGLDASNIVDGSSRRRVSDGVSAPPVSAGGMKVSFVLSLSRAWTVLRPRLARMLRPKLTSTDRAQEAPRRAGAPQHADRSPRRRSQAHHLDRDGEVRVRCMPRRTLADAVRGRAIGDVFAVLPDSTWLRDYCACCRGVQVELTCADEVIKRPIAIKDIRVRWSRARPALTAAATTGCRRISQRRCRQAGPGSDVRARLTRIMLTLAGSRASDRCLLLQTAATLPVC